MDIVVLRHVLRFGIVGSRGALLLGSGLAALKVEVADHVVDHTLTPLE